MHRQVRGPATRTPERLLAAQNLVLEMIATGRPLEEILGKIVELVESRDPSAICCLFLLDKNALKLDFVLAPKLPRSFVEGVRSFPIGPSSGACGGAVYRRKRIIVADVKASRFYKKKCRDFVLAHGLRSCWCAPIFSPESGILGGLGVYHGAPHRPDEGEIGAVESAARLAAIAVCRSRFQERMRAGMEHFRALVESASDAIYIVGAHGVIQYVNPAIERILDFPPTGLIGKPVLNLAHPSDFEQARLAFARALEVPGVQAPVERLYLHRAGVPRVFEVVVNNQLADEAIGGLIYTARDITSRKAAEREFISSQESYRDLVENASEIVYSYDLSGRIRSLNKAGEAIIGCPREEALDRNIADFVSPEYRSVLAEMTNRQIGGETHATYELEVTGKDGGRKLLEVNARLIFDGGRPVGVQGIGRDVTEQRQYQRHLLQSQKMEAIGRLAAGVAHDFNNLLTVITGYSQWLLEALPPDSPLVENASEIALAAERGASLTNRLLSFSRGHRIEPILIDLNSLVAQLSQMLRRIIGEDIDLVTSTAPDLWLIRADPGQIEQVILNLVVNARDAMPDGGRLVIQTANAAITPESQARLDRLPGDYVMLSVTDTGVGIEESIKPHIFEPFFTTKEVGKGTGLGLSTVYVVVRQCDGWVDVESVPGAGAVFRLYFPRVTGDVQTAPVTRRAPAAGGSETILLVEDETAVRRVAGEMLTRLGYTVLEAHDVASAFEAAKSRQSRIDLLVTDIVMPHSSGPDLAKRLGERIEGLKVLFMSGYATGAVIDPGAGFLRKPFSPDVLAAKVREILDK